MKGAYGLRACVFRGWLLRGLLLVFSVSSALGASVTFNLSNGNCGPGSTGYQFAYTVNNGATWSSLEQGGLSPGGSRNATYSVPLGAVAAIFKPQYNLAPGGIANIMKRVDPSATLESELCPSTDQITTSISLTNTSGSLAEFEIFWMDGATKHVIDTVALPAGATYNGTFTFDNTGTPPVIQFTGTMPGVTIGPGGTVEGTVVTIGGSTYPGTQWSYGAGSTPGMGQGSGGGYNTGGGPVVNNPNGTINFSNTGVTGAEKTQQQGFNAMVQQLQTMGGIEQGLLSGIRVDLDELGDGLGAINDTLSEIADNTAGGGGGGGGGGSAPDYSAVLEQIRQNTDNTDNSVQENTGSTSNLLTRVHHAVTNALDRANATNTLDAEKFSNSYMTNLGAAAAAVGEGAFDVDLTAPGSNAGADPDMTVAIGSWVVDLNPLHNASFADLAAMVRAFFVWMFTAGFVLGIVKMVEGYVQASTSARQAQSSGTAILGTNINSGLAIAMAAVITVVLTAIPVVGMAFLATHGGAFSAVLGVNPFTGVSGPVAGAIYLADAFIPLDMLITQTFWMIVGRISMGATYWTATTIVRFLVG